MLLLSFFLRPIFLHDKFNQRSGVIINTAPFFGNHADGGLDGGINRDADDILIQDYGLPQQKASKARVYN